MKFPITEKFLWDVYNAFETLDELHDPFKIKTMKEVCFPEFYKLKRDWERKLDRKKFAKLLYYLKKKGLIKIKEIENKEGIVLTPGGIQKVLKIKYKIIEKKKRKDGKWQMVIFDIPEKLRRIRENFRNNLKILGYQKLQKSIWISPYDVLKETQEIILRYGIEKFVRLLLIEEIET